MLDLLPIIIRLPDGLKAKYDSPFHRGIFDRDILSDRLKLFITPEDYNAANPVEIETTMGYCAPYVEKTRNPYQLEVVDNDRRSPVKRHVLRDLLNIGGNVHLYGVAKTYTQCEHPLVVIEDYHELSEPVDFERGYSVRVGILQVESLKGNYGRKSNVYAGNSYIITPNTPLLSGAVLDSVEWQNYRVVNKYNSSTQFDLVWAPNINYNGAERLAAMAPEGVTQRVDVNGGVRLIFTHLYNIVNNDLAVYLPNY